MAGLIRLFRDYHFSSWYIIKIIGSTIAMCNTKGSKSTRVMCFRNCLVSRMKINCDLTRLFNLKSVFNKSILDASPTKLPSSLSNIKKFQMINETWWIRIYSIQTTEYYFINQFLWIIEITGWDWKWIISINPHE